MKEVKISGLNKGDRVFESDSGDLIKVRLARVPQGGDVLSVVRLSGAICDTKGKALRRRGAEEADDPMHTHLINKPVMVTVQKNDDPDFDPQQAIKASIKQHVEDTARMRGQVAAIDDYLKEWE